MISIGSKESSLERYAYFVLELIWLLVGLVRIVYDISACFCSGAFPKSKKLLFAIL